jgi:hypothetical protein
MEVRKQVQVAQHGPRRARRRVTGQGAGAQPLLKLQQRRRVELGEAAEALAVHPLQQAAQGEEVLRHRARSQWQPGEHRVRSDEGDELLLVSRSVA